MPSSMIPRPFPRGVFQLALALVAWNTPVRAQEAAEQAPAGETAEQVTAPVVLDGVTLFRMRGVSAFPAERRAGEIAEPDRGTGRGSELPGRVSRRSGRHRWAARSSPAAAGSLRWSMPTPSSKASGVRSWPRSTGDESPKPSKDSATTGRARSSGPMPRGHWRPRSPWRWRLWLGRRALRLIRATLEQRYRPRVRNVQVGTVEIVRAEQLWQGLHRALGMVAVLLALLAGLSLPRLRAAPLPLDQGARQQPDPHPAGAAGDARRRARSGSFPIWCSWSSWRC